MTFTRPILLQPRATALLDTWGMVFECGTDFFGETGFPLPHRVQPREDQPAAEQGFRAAAHAAWLRVGALFLERRKAANERRDIPWAQEEFGEPPCQ